jgi:hypothetical protein
VRRSVGGVAAACSRNRSIDLAGRNFEFSQLNVEHRARKLGVDERSIRLYAPSNGTRVSVDRRAAVVINRVCIDWMVGFGRPAILDFDTCAVREKEWDNIVTCHQSHIQIRTWSFDKRRLGARKLLPPQAKEQVAKNQLDPSSIHRLSLWDMMDAQQGGSLASATATVKLSSAAAAAAAATPRSGTCAAVAVAVSACGHYCFAARDNGDFDKFNIQSTIHRNSCFAANDQALCHTRAITAITSDSVNTIIITASLDGTIKVCSSIEID